MQFVRVGDIAVGTCYCHTTPQSVVGIVSSGSENVVVENMSSARLGDIVIFNCGHIGTIATASGKTIVNGRGLARTTDLVVGCMTAVLVTGANKTETV